MSQHWYTLESGRKVLYGLDVPTGGFFISEFYLDEEIVSDAMGEVAFAEDGLVLSELISVAKELYGIDVNADEMVQEWKDALPPTPLQAFVYASFNEGDTLEQAHLRVREDLKGFTGNG